MERMRYELKASGERKPSIDELLELESQQMMTRLVRALPEEVPSMAWRSELNAKLAEKAKAARSRRRVWWVVSPSFGVVAAAAICFAVFMPARHIAGPGTQPAPIAAAQSLEDQLFASHNESTTSQDVVGSGLSSAEVQQSSDDSPEEDAPSS